MSEKPRWYVAHTYSGYENKVKANIEKTIENRNMNDQILEIAVPTQEFVEEKNGKKKTVSRKIFPGYVLLKMFMNDETWYIVRNTRGVTSFVGPGSKPVPLTDQEVANMGVANADTIDFEVGDTIIVTTGSLVGTTGVVNDINKSKRILSINALMFGRETKVELGFEEVRKN